MKAVSLLLAFSFSSCALLKPTATVRLTRVSDLTSLVAGDSTETMFEIDSGIHTEFDLNGSNRVSIDPGSWNYIAKGIEPGWHYIDLIDNTVWLRGVPVWLRGADSISISFGDNYLILNNRPVFEVYQYKNINYPFTPAFSLRCYGCNWNPVIKLDGSRINYVPPPNNSISGQAWMAVDAGWHTIEIDSPLDNVHLYYRTLFDNYTETEFSLYPVQMN